MNCDICKAKFTQVGADLICANGHTILNAVMVADETIEGTFKTGARKKKTETKLEKSKFRTNIAILFLIKMLFYEGMVFFGIKNDRFYKYFTGLVRVTEDFTYFFSNRISFLPSLLYLSKLTESDFYLVDTFARKYAEFDIQSRFYSLKKKYNLQAVDMGSFLMPADIFRQMERTLSLLGDFDNYFLLENIRKESNEDYDPEITVDDTMHKGRCGKYVYTEESMPHVQSSLFLKYIEAIKNNFRCHLKRDLKYMLKYLKYFCSIFDISVDEESFKKFLYASDLKYRCFVPEMQIFYFFALYFNKDSNFENSELEQKIFYYSGQRRIGFISRVNNVIIKYNMRATPDLFHKTYNDERNKKFKYFRCAVNYVKKKKKKKFKD